MFEFLTALGLLRIVGLVGGYGSLVSVVAIVKLLDGCLWMVFLGF